MSSISTEYDSNNLSKVHLLDESVSKIMLTINSSGETKDSIYDNIPIDYSSRKYIHVKVNNIIDEYDKDGKHT